MARTRPTAVSGALGCTRPSGRMADGVAVRGRRQRWRKGPGGVRGEQHRVNALVPVSPPAAGTIGVWFGYFAALRFHPLPVLPQTPLMVAALPTFLPLCPAPLDPCPVARLLPQTALMVAALYDRAPAVKWLVAQVCVCGCVCGGDGCKPQSGGWWAHNVF